MALPTNEMARLFASCDVLLGPSRVEEGFGLPAAEAMASGVPSVLSEIPSFLSWDDVRDYATFAADGDGVALGEQLAELLADPALAARLARRGRAVVEQFRAARTGRAAGAAGSTALAGLAAVMANTQSRQMKSSGASSTP